MSKKQVLSFVDSNLASYGSTLKKKWLELIKSMKILYLLKGAAELWA